MRSLFGKVDDRADHDREHVRHEALVALIHDGAAGIALVERRARRGLEIDDAAAQVGHVARAGRARRRDIGPPLDRLRELADVEAAANAARRLGDAPPARTAGDEREADDRRASGLQNQYSTWPANRANRGARGRRRGRYAATRP